MLDLYNTFWDKLKDVNIDKSDLEYLIKGTTEKLQNPVQGDYPRWFKAYENLPAITDVHKVANENAINCHAYVTNSTEDKIRECYQQLIPWRKGPFKMFSTHIDAEWQSYMKWNRIEKFLPEIKNKTILDVGCGNGYYLFRMMDKNPLLLMGIDPGLLQIMQFWSIEKYVQSGACVLPLSIQQMPKSLNCFDMVFSMGVLYHRKSPIHHIKELADCIKPNGHLVIETLIVSGDERTCLLPTGRYAQMRNVWFLPSIAMLKIMLERSGFKDVKCIDTTITTTEEQRTTDWMKFHSLKEFLSENQSQTIEGYDLPKRATLVAQKK